MDDKKMAPAPTEAQKQKSNQSQFNHTGDFLSTRNLFVEWLEDQIWGIFCLMQNPDLNQAEREVAWSCFAAFLSGHLDLIYRR